MSNPTSDNALTEEEMKERSSIIYEVLHGLEDLRSRLIDVEAVSHAAADILAGMPYIPAAPATGIETHIENPGEPPGEVTGQRDEGGEVHEPKVAEPDSAAGGMRAPRGDIRLQFGRLQSLVHRTAELSFSVLQDIHALIEKASMAASDRHGQSPAGEGQRVLYSCLETQPAENLYR